MSESSTIFIGLDQHKDSITVSYVGADRSLERICLGPIGPRTSDVDAMVRKLQSKENSSLRTAGLERMQSRPAASGPATKVFVLVPVAGICRPLDLCVRDDVHASGSF